MCARQASVKKPTKTKVKKPSKTELLEEKAKLFDRIRAKEKERRKLQLSFDNLTKERKAAKEALGFCESEICNLGHALDEKHPLFDENRPTSTTTEGALPEAGGDWRALPISELKLTESVERVIQDAGFKTIGALSAHMTDQGDWWARNIKGVGDSGREAIELAYADFWKAHPEFCAS